MEFYPEDFSFATSAKIADDLIETNANLAQARSYIYGQYFGYITNNLDYFYIDLSKYEPIARSILMEELVAKFPFIMTCHKITNDSVKIYDWDKTDYKILPRLDIVCDTVNKITPKLDEEMAMYKVANRTNSFSANGFYNLKILHLAVEQSIGQDISRYHKYQETGHYLIGLTNRFMYDMLKQTPGKITNSYGYNTVLMKL